MKKLYFFISLLTLSLSSLAKTYYIYTAKSSGDFDDADLWTSIARVDKDQKDKYIIPNTFMVTVNTKTKNISNDIDLILFGSLKLGSSTEVNLSDKSSIAIMGNGSIIGTGNSQQISIGNVVKYNGNKNKTMTGLLFADNTTGMAPSGFSSYTILPLQFLSFSATENRDKSVSLVWSSINESHNCRFEIQKSFNGIDWSSISVVNASEKVNTINYYNYNDLTTSGEFTSYRVKQINDEGLFKYSSVKMIQKTGKNPSAIITISSKSVNVQFEQKMLSEVQIKLLNSSGKMIASQSYNKPTEQISFSLTGMVQGVYILSVTDNSGWKQTRKFLYN